MGFSKDLMKQIILLMAAAAAMILIIANGSAVFNGIVICIGILTPFLAGGAIAFILNIPMSALENKVLYRLDGTKAAKLKRPTGILITLLLLAGVLAAVISILVPNLSVTFTEIAKQLPVFLDEASRWVNSLNIPGIQMKGNILETLSTNIEGFNEKVAGFIQSGAGTILGSTVNVVKGVVSTLVSSIIAFVFAIYILAQKERLQRQAKRVLKAYVPEEHRNRILKICDLLKTNFTNFITGQCLDAFILGTLFVIVLSVLRLPYALMIGVIIAFSALIPIVGAFLGCIIGVILILMVEPVKVLYFLIVFIILQQLEGKLIYPKVVGGSVGLPAIWVLVAIAAGGSLFGVVGMLVFIPLVSAAYTLLKEDVKKRCDILEKTENSAPGPKQTGDEDENEDEKEKEKLK